MSGAVAIGWGRTGSGATARGARDVATVRLLAFGGLAGVGTAQWASLLLDPPGWRFAAALAIAVATALALLALPDVPSGRRPAPAIVALAGAIAGLVAIGIPAAQFLPWRWDDLADTVGAGLDGLRGQFDYPLGTAIDPARVIVVAAMPVLLALAALLSFAPRRRGGMGLAGLVVLITAYAIPATARPTSAPVIWGLAVLVLASLWLWAPRLRSPAALAAILCAGGLAAAGTAALAGDEPLIDYRSWTLHDPNGTVTYSWDHTYGPIDWPRDGTRLFRVDSDGPGYWRAEVLDDFYGTHWRRSSAGGAATPNPVPVGSVGDASWVRKATFSVLALDGPLLLSPGDSLGVNGVDGVVQDADGTIHSDEDPLTKGSQYTVSGYFPNPSPARMRAASGRYPAGVGSYTSISIPVSRPGSSLSPSNELLSPERVSVPLWGGGSPDPRSLRAIQLSPYSRVAELARRLTAGRATAYGAVRAIEGHLRRGYRYDESPPPRRLPLSAFLFRDRIGYCQQFSGAMALMLRMVGIPARVAVGFTAGTPLGKGSFEVTDFDAHSWVEVYFSGIGWVTFDPTPDAAPAQSQFGDLGNPALGFGLGGKAERGTHNSPAPGDIPVAERAGASVAEDGSSPLLVALLIAGGLGVIGAAVVVLRAARYRRLAPPLAAERELGELLGALRAGGVGEPRPPTLLRIERRLRVARRPRAAAYVAGLRDHRYRGAGGSVPTLGARRRARSELGAGGGIARRLRVLIAMPPGGPRYVPEATRR